MNLSAELPAELFDGMYDLLSPLPDEVFLFSLEAASCDELGAFDQQSPMPALGQENDEFIAYDDEQSPGPANIEPIAFDDEQSPEPASNQDNDEAREFHELLSTGTDVFLEPLERLPVTLAKVKEKRGEG